MLISACTAFTACNDDAEDSPVLASNKLNITVGLQQPQGRAIITGTTLPESSSIGVLLDDGEATSYDAYNNIKFTAATENSKQVWNPASDIVLDETKGTLYAYYPYAAGTNLAAIPVETASQTDYLYAQPVANVSEKNANVSVTMKHMLANVNVTVNKGTYVGTGNISKISIQSDGIATAGIFNAAQETPAFTTTTGTGTAIEQTISTTLGNAIDIMVVPTGAAKPITFMVRVDDVDYTVTSSDVTLESGYSYNYNLSLNSTFLNVDKVSVAEWNHLTKENLTLEKYIPSVINVYAVTAEGEMIDYNTADVSCIGVALHVTGKDFEQKFMIAKNDATDDGSNYTLYYDNDKGDQTPVNYTKVDGTNSSGFLPKPDGSYMNMPHLSKDFTTWTAGALSDFDYKTNTLFITTSSNDSKDMCKVLETFNGGTNSQNNEGFTDWYVPAVGQLALIYLAKTYINEALAKIGGTALESTNYWSSSGLDNGSGWYVNFTNGRVVSNGKSYGYRVRFIRDWEENPFGVYAITADGELVDKSEGNADCIGVALLTNNQSIMIPKEDATDGTNTTLHWSKNLYGKDITALPNSGENAGFNGKDNTNKIIAGYTEHNVEMDSRDMCRVLQNFNATDTFHDWYIPSANQLSEIYAWRVFIKETLNNISGAEFKWSMDYWSSCEGNGDLATSVYFGGGQIFNSKKDSQAKVRFVRDLQ